VSLLAYSIRSNHVHLLAFAEQEGQISQFMKWSGYSELMGMRKRYRLLDMNRLLSLVGAEDVESFRKNLNAALALAIEKQHWEREPRWTESLAVAIPESNSTLIRIDACPGV
jgi:REP element-mobilizing transposase RayT